MCIMMTKLGASDPFHPSPNLQILPSTLPYAPLLFSHSLAHPSYIISFLPPFTPFPPSPYVPLFLLSFLHQAKLLNCAQGWHSVKPSVMFAPGQANLAQFNPSHPSPPQCWSAQLTQAKPSPAKPSQTRSSSVQPSQTKPSQAETNAPMPYPALPT